MFLGEYQHNVDSKGRAIMPSNFREDLGEKFIITKGLDNCLFIFDMKSWEEINIKIKALPMTDGGVRKFVRFFFGGARECIPDSQGRIIIPANLKTFAGINKEILSVGVANRLEIWSKENWDKYNNEDNFIDDELAIKMSELGI